MDKYIVTIVIQKNKEKPSVVTLEGQHLECQKDIGYNVIEPFGSIMSECRHNCQFDFRLHLWSDVDPGVPGVPKDFHEHRYRTYCPASRQQCKYHGEE